MAVSNDPPVLTCVDTSRAFTLIHQIDDGDFPERTAYLRALLARTAADLRDTADFIEERLRQTASASVKKTKAK